MSSTHCKKEVVAVLELSFAGNSHSIDFCTGDRLFVGSDENSDLCIPDSSVAPTHCLIFEKSGSVGIEDCYSREGTYVDTQRIRTVQLTGNADVKVGAATISVKLPNVSVPVADGKVTALSSSALPKDRSSTLCENLRPKTPEVPDTSERDPRTLPPKQPADMHEIVDELKFQLFEAQEEIRILQRRLESSVTPGLCEEIDPFQQEMIELLRAEVLELQTRLAERDTERPDVTKPDSHDEDVISRDEAEKLVQRLEQLLAELQDRDMEIAGLTRLLAATEDSIRAEREERAQMDQWVGDIEKRFGCREQEWQEERVRLQQAIDAISAERDRAEAAMNADISSGKLEATQNILRSLRESSNVQRQQLAGSEEMVKELRRKLEQAQSLHSREDRLQLAQERAELARERQELEALRKQQLRSGVDEAGLKLRALRQHLNEIHEDERIEREDRKLSTRISRLWRCLEGRSS